MPWGITVNGALTYGYIAVAVDKHDGGFLDDLFWAFLTPVGTTLDFRPFVPESGIA